MNFHDAMTNYRSATAPEDYKTPDPLMSKRRGALWTLKDSHGRLLAITHDDGRVMRPGMKMTTTCHIGE